MPSLDHSRVRDGTRRGERAGTLAEQIGEALRERIVRYDLPPGYRMLETEIASEFGASRTPVREALRRLEQGRLITRDGPGGYYVRRFDLAEMDDLYEVRIALETLAIRTLGSRVSPNALSHIKAVWRAFPPKGSPSEALAADEAFHEALAEASGNSVLTESLKAVNERIHIIRRIDFTAEHRLSESKHEHALVLGELEAGRVRRAQELLEQHIRKSKKKIGALAKEGLAQVYQGGGRFRLLGRLDDDQGGASGSAQPPHRVPRPPVVRPREETS